MSAVTTRMWLGEREQLSSTERRRVEIGGHTIVVVNLGDELLALDDTCTHQSASLAQVGEVDRDAREIECCMHGARFSLDNCSVTAFPASKPLATYPLVFEGNDVYVELPA